MAKQLPLLFARTILGGATAALALGGAPALAQIQMIVTNSSVTPGGAGSFDVVLLNSNSSGSIDVGGFSFELGLSGGSGITFTAANTNTTVAPYIYGTDQTPPFSFDTFPNTSFTASDADFSAPGFVAVAAGTEVGLGHVTYSSALNTAVGPYTVTLESIGGQTALSDAAGQSIAFSPTNGTITVGAAGATPEPVSLTLFGLGGLVALGRKRIRRRVVV